MTQELHLLKEELATLKSEISSLPPESYQCKIYTAHYKTLSAKYSSISSNLPPLPPPLTTSSHTTPIKCGLRGIANGPIAEAQTHWTWDSKTATKSKALAKIADDILKAFSVSLVSTATLEAILSKGGLKPALTDLGFAPLLLLPDFLRKAQGFSLFSTFESALLLQCKKN